MNRVLSTKEFDTFERLLPNEYQKQIEKIIKQLKRSNNVGKPLSYPYFKEKKFGKYRIYFLIYKESKTILLVSISDKKAQQETINGIKRDIDFYYNLIKRNI